MGFRDTLWWAVISAPPPGLHSGSRILGAGPDAALNAEPDNLGSKPSLRFRERSKTPPSAETVRIAMSASAEEPRTPAHRGDDPVI